MISFAEKYPDLVGEWAPENDASPSEVSYGSNRMIMWRGICGHYWTASAKNRGRGHGCPYCSGNKVLIGYNDLKTRSPKVAQEWSKRNETKPEDYASLSNTEVWWTCKKCKIDWRARISDRTTGHGCPNCASLKIIRGKNDLQTLFPDIAKEWSSNNPGMPFSISPYSKKSILWECQECGNPWYGSVVNRVNGLKCPYCSGEKLKKGLNDLQTLHPELAKEWDRIRNGNSPTMVRANSDRNSFWVDEYGHKWVARVSERVLGRGGCLICAVENKRQEILDYVNDVADSLGLEVQKNTEFFNGMPFEAYLPKIKTAIMITPECSEADLKKADKLNAFCMSAGIAMFRVLFPDSSVFSNCKIYRLISAEDEGYKPIIDNLLESEGLNIVTRLNNAINSTYGGAYYQDEYGTLDSLAHARARENFRARTGATEQFGAREKYRARDRAGTTQKEDTNGSDEIFDGTLAEKYVDATEKSRMRALTIASDELLTSNLIKVIIDNPSYTQDDIARTIGVSRRVVQRITDKLRTEGKLCRIGSTRYGHWKVCEDIADYMDNNINDSNKASHKVIKTRSNPSKPKVTHPKRTKKYSRYSLEYKIIKAIKDNPYITQTELSEATESALRTVKRATTRMIDDGTIIRTDGKRFGKWEIVDPDNN